MRDYFDVMEEREQPTGPVHFVVSGPSVDAAKQAAAQVRTLFQAAGKVVRLFTDSRATPDEIPPCDIAIIVHKHPQEAA
jgi:hypothetical protein